MNEFNFIKLTGKTFLITGAASGIGRATAILLSKLDANLVLLDRDEKNLNETFKKCKKTDFVGVVDLTDYDNLIKIINKAVSKMGKLDGAAHFAGCPCIAPLKVVSKRMCISILEINTLTAMELSKLFSSKKFYRGNGGSIVLISSVYANVGSAANVVYSMSKSAIQGITKSLAVELASKKIRVNCIAPGFIKTNMGESINHFFEDGHDALIEKLHPLGLGEAEDVANMAVFLLSDASKWITGAIINVDGGFCAQ